jgi:hypothetical protein
VSESSVDSRVEPPSRIRLPHLSTDLDCRTRRIRGDFLLAGKAERVGHEIMKLARKSTVVVNEMESKSFC